jgi:hypothetical protein
MFSKSCLPVPSFPGASRFDKSLSFGRHMALPAKTLSFSSHSLPSFHNVWEVKKPDLLLSDEQKKGNPEGCCDTNVPFLVLADYMHGKDW